MLSTRSITNNSNKREDSYNVTEAEVKLLSQRNIKPTTQQPQTKNGNSHDVTDEKIKLMEDRNKAQIEMKPEPKEGVSKEFPNVFQPEKKITSEKPNTEATTEIIRSFHGSEMEIFNKHEDGSAPKSSDLLIKHINFARISEAETQQFLENINLISDKDKKIVVSLKNDKFIFFDDKKHYMGFITVEHIARYLGSHYDVKKQFMRHFNIKEYNDAKELIETFVCTIQLNKKIRYVSIDIKNHMESAFMGDIEMIVKLNKLLHSFLKVKLGHELNYVDEKYRKRIEQIIKQFVYTMLNYTMGLIEIVSSQIKNDKSKKKLAKELVKYSINTVYRISKFVQEQTGIILRSNQEIEKLLIMNFKLRNIIESRMNDLIEEIKNQNLNLRSTNITSGQLGGNKREDEGDLHSKAITLSNSDSNSYSNSDSNSYSNEETDSYDSVELSKSVVSDIEYNISEDKSHFSAIYDI